MTEENCKSDRLPSPLPDVPFPVALYVSDGLIFELYDGGQPSRRFSVRWETLKPVANGNQACSIHS